MADIIRFDTPVMSRTGATDFGLRMLIVDTQQPLVKIMLQEVDPSGAFINNGETVSVRHEGDVARAFLAQPAYGAVLAGLPGALVAGSSLPESAEVVPTEPAPQPAGAAEPSTKSRAKKR